MAKRTPPTHQRLAALLTELGGRLRAARMRRGMTQADMALRVGVSVPTLSKLESGDPSTNFATVARVLAVLGIADDLALIASEDHLGRQLQDAALKRPAATLGKRRVQP